MLDQRPTDDRSHPLPSFAQALEDRARRIVSAVTSSASRVSTSSLLEDDVALRLHQIDGLRRLEQDTKRSLLQAECDIETELMQMEQRTPRYSPYRFPEREKLQRRLAQIGQERRRLTMALAERLDALHDRLLSSLHKHWQLNPADLGANPPSWVNAVTRGSKSGPDKAH